MAVLIANILERTFKRQKTLVEVAYKVENNTGNKNDKDKVCCCFI